MTQTQTHRVHEVVCPVCSAVGAHYEYRYGVCLARCVTGDTANCTTIATAAQLHNNCYSCRFMTKSFSTGERQRTNRVVPSNAHCSKKRFICLSFTIFPSTHLPLASCTVVCMGAHYFECCFLAIQCSNASLLSEHTRLHALCYVRAMQAMSQYCSRRQRRRVTFALRGLRLMKILKKAWPT